MVINNANGADGDLTFSFDSYTFVVSLFPDSEEEWKRVSGKVRLHRESRGLSVYILVPL